MNPYNAYDMKMLFLSLCIAGILGCASVPPVVPPPGTAQEARIFAVAVSLDRSTLWYVTGRETCELRSLALSDRSTRLAFSIDWCPTRIKPVDDESLVLTDGAGRGAWKRFDGRDVVEGSVLTAASRSNYVLAEGTRLIWSRDSGRRDIGETGTMRHPVIAPGSGDLFAIVRNEDGEHIDRMTADGTKAVSAVFPKIDSFDLAPRGEELALSAQRNGSFDVAIASTDGKTMNWIPADAADEVGVAWAPRGNKVSFLIRRPDSTLVRSVHVPTSFQLTFDSPLETVRALAWEPRAERLAMILDGPAVSPGVDWVEYSGANREALLPHGTKLGREPERIAFGTADAIVLPPHTVRYGEKGPPVVVPQNEPPGWGHTVPDPAPPGGRLLLMRPADWAEGAPLAQLLSGFPWADADQVVVIAQTRGYASVPRVSGAGQTLVTTGTKLHRGRFFDETRLESGAILVTAETWGGAMAYLRARFQPKR